MTRSDAPRREWRHVGLFLGITFTATWLVDLGIDLHGGLGRSGVITTPAVIVDVHFQMLLPACTAILLGLFAFRESPIHVTKRTGAGRSFYYVFLGLTLVYGLAALATWLRPDHGATLLLAELVPEGATYLALFVLVGLRVFAGRGAMERVQLGWGSARYWFGLGLVIAGFYALQVALNAVTGMGPDRLVLPAVPAGPDPRILALLAGLEGVVVAPVMAIVLAFGEEYGWRGYLQGELVKLGRRRGVLLVGFIWGTWHWPLIVMGYSYPGYPVVGVLLTVLFTIGLGVVLGYAVLKTGSILLAAYLHALNDQVTAYLLAIGLKPYNPVYSFGIGIYGVATLAVIALFLLRDRIWRSDKAAGELT